MSKIVQYELWQECNNFCTYCTLGGNIKQTSDEMKLDAINTAIKEIQTFKQGEVSTIGFIGGEFFQGQLHNPKVKNAFLSLISISNQLLNQSIIYELWINATLTIGNQHDLYTILDMIDCKDKVWILTSYDNKGRFHNEQKLLNWEHHISYIHKNYPDIRINTTSIITGDFIKAYINDEFNLNEFKNKYNTELFLKTPVKPDDCSHLSKKDINDMMGYYFFPTQFDFLKFLIKYKEKEGDNAFDLLFSNDLKAEELHKNFNDSSLRNVIFNRSADFKEELNCDSKLKHIETLDCGHSNVYQCYIDSDGCAICDKIRINHL